MVLADAAGPGCPGPFSIVDFGAVGDGVTVNTAALQAAIAAATACPDGGRVIVPFAGANASTFVSNSIFLDDNVDLHVESGATILGDPTIANWPSVWRPLFSGYGIPGLVNGARCTANNATACTAWRALRNVSITGGGSIDGNGFVWWAASTWWPTVPRPYLLELAWVDGLRVAGVSLLHSALWTIVPSSSANILIEGVLLDAGVERDLMPYNGYNIDGRE